MIHDILFFWVTVSILLGITITIIVLPLIRRWKTPSKIFNIRRIHNFSVYRDQLLEIERDFENGMLTAEHTESRRTEIQRRMLQAASAFAGHAGLKERNDTLNTKVIQSLLMSLVIAVGAVGLYLNRGAPGLPDRPAATELSTMVQKNAERLSDELAQYMEENPDKVEGWMLLARFQRQLGVYAGAARSLHMAIKQGVEDTDTLASYGEMLVADRGGQVTSEACTVFRLAHHHNNANAANDDPRAAFYIGLAAFQEEDSRCAISIWRGLEMHAPPGVPWLDMLRTHIESVTAQEKLTDLIPQQLWNDPLCGTCATGSDSPRNGSLGTGIDERANGAEELH